MEIISLTTGLLAGALLSYFIGHLLNKLKTVPKSDFDQLTTRFNEMNMALKLAEEKAGTISASNKELSGKLDEKVNALFDVQNNATMLKTQLSNKEVRISELVQNLLAEQELNKTQQNEITFHKQKIAEIAARNNALSGNLFQQTEINNRQTQQIEEQHAKQTDLVSRISRLTADNNSLTEKLASQKREMEELQRTAHLQFEKIANKLFEEKSSKFTEANKVNMESLLNPLKEDINKLKTKVEETYDKESKQRF